MALTVSGSPAFSHRGDARELEPHARRLRRQHHRHERAERLHREPSLWRLRGCPPASLLRSAPPAPAGASTLTLAAASSAARGSFHRHHHRHVRQPEQHRDHQSDGERGSGLYDRGIARQPERSPGGSGASTITVAPAGGTSTAWSLFRLAGLPAGVTATFSPAHGHAHHHADFAMPQPARRPALSTVTVTGTSGTASSKTTDRPRRIVAPASFTLSATPASLASARRERWRAASPSLRRTASTAPWRWRLPGLPAGRYRDFRRQ